LGGRKGEKRQELPPPPQKLITSPCAALLFELQITFTQGTKAKKILRGRKGGESGTCDSLHDTLYPSSLNISGARRGGKKVLQKKRKMSDNWIFFRRGGKKEKKEKRVPTRKKRRKGVRRAPFFCIPS